MIPRRRFPSTLLVPLLLAGLLAPTPFPTPVRGDEPKLSEAAAWLRHYLTLDTTNPPGNETEAARWLAAVLRREGVEPRLLTSPGGRTSLVARIEGSGGDGKALVLLHHVDVVAAGEGWSVEPFAGKVRNGYLWGRGALDAKSLGVAQLAAFVALARAQKQGFTPRRDVVYAAVADEENGGGEGVGWLLEAHPEVFRGAAGVLNEGGVTRMRDGKPHWWGVEIAQKRPLWLEISTRARGSHGSAWNPGNANHVLIQALARLLERPARWRVDEPVRLYLEAIAPFQGGHLAPVLADIEDHITPDGPTANLMPGMAGLFLDSVQVTQLDAGDRVNVIPATARARLDIRLLPDTDHTAFLAQVERVLGDDVTVRVILDAPRSEPSPTSGPVYELLRTVLGREAPVVPTMISGFTDSRYFRQRGIPAYGVAPFAIEGPDLMGIHAKDERIPLGAFEDGVDRMTRLVRAWAGTRSR